MKSNSACTGGCWVEAQEKFVALSGCSRGRRLRLEADEIDVKVISSLAKFGDVFKHFVNIVEAGDV